MKLALLLLLSGCHYCTTAAGIGVCSEFGAAVIGGTVDGIVGAAWANGALRPGGASLDSVDAGSASR